MKAFLLSLLICFSTLVLNAQENDSIPNIKDLEISHIHADLIGNFYSIDLDGKLYKSDSSGQILESYQNRNALAISHIDVSDPLKILVFYKDFEIIEFLNSELDSRGNMIRLR